MLKTVSINSVKEIDNFSRSSVKQSNITQLMNSIQHVGLINPPTVKQDGRGYRLIAGHSRLEAAKKLGWKKIPVIVKTSLNGDEDVIDDITTNVAENTVRVQPSLFEEGRAAVRLFDDMGMTIPQIAIRFSQPKSRVKQALELYREGVPKSMRKKIVPTSKGKMPGQITYSVATAVKNALKNHKLPEKTRTRLWTMAENGATASEIREAARNAAKGKAAVSDVKDFRLPLKLSKRRVRAFERVMGMTAHEYAENTLRADKEFGKLFV